MIILTFSHANIFDNIYDYLYDNINDLLYLYFQFFIFIMIIIIYNENNQEKTLKSFMDIVSIDSSLKKRADDVLTGLSETVGKATEIQGIQSSGLLDMTDGLASNAKACKDSLNACIESGECVCV